MNHTPGPWKAEKNLSLAWNINSGPDPDLGYDTWVGLASVFGCQDNPQIGRKKVEVNARLIAQAPALLEALEELLSWDTLAPVEAVKNAKAVIKSARGEA